MSENQEHRNTTVQNGNKIGQFNYKRIKMNKITFVTSIHQGKHEARAFRGRLIAYGKTIEEAKFNALTEAQKYLNQTYNPFDTIPMLTIKDLNFKKERVSPVTDLERRSKSRNGIKYRLMGAMHAYSLYSHPGECLTDIEKSRIEQIHIRIKELIDEFPLGNLVLGFKSKEIKI